MKIKGTFLSYISEEKRLRKQQSRVLKPAAKRSGFSLEEATANKQVTANAVGQLQYN